MKRLIEAPDLIRKKAEIPEEKEIDVKNFSALMTELLSAKKQLDKFEAEVEGNYDLHSKVQDLRSKIDNLSKKLDAVSTKVDEKPDITESLLSLQEDISKLYTEIDKFPAVTANVEALSMSITAVLSREKEVTDAISNSHEQGTDTSLGKQTQDLNMGGHKIIDVEGSEVANKEYVDQSIGRVGMTGRGGGISKAGTPDENDYARWTKRGKLEGRSYAEVKADLDLEIGTDVPALSDTVLKSDYPASSILVADSADLPTAITLAASRIPARLASGGIVAATPAQILALLSGQASATFNWNSQVMENVGKIISKDSDALVRDVSDSYIRIFGGASASSASIQLMGKTHATLPGMIILYNPNAALTARERLRITGAVNTAVATWSYITHTGLVLSGALDARGQSITGINALTATGTTTLAVALTGVLRADSGVVSVDTTLDADAVAAVNAAGLTLAAGKTVEFTTPSGSRTASGIIVTETAGASLVFGNACYRGTDGKMEKALADDAAITIPATHFCLATIAENAAGLFLKYGEVYSTADSWAFDIGLSVYLSAATAGLITKTMPTKVTGNQVQVLGIAKAADKIEWNPSSVVVEYA